MFDTVTRWLSPHTTEDRRLYRCICGDLFWSDSPQEVRRKHVGHRHSMCFRGSMWEFFKLKIGWIK